MVRGLDRFRDYFQGYEDNYVLIGGTACSLAMEEAGLEFRVTMDLDIVLCVEALNVDFVKVFWNFIKAGRYRNRQKSTGENRFHRFYEPEDKTFPEMLELFSKKPDALTYEGEGDLTPIPMGDEVSSLSAILLDELYYEFLHTGKRDFDGLSMIDPERIIPLKARAWLDLTERKEKGGAVDAKDIKKHKNDIFRLYRIVSPDIRVDMPLGVRSDMSRFLSAMKGEPIDLKQLGYRSETVEQVLDALRTIYGLVR
jgi:hypothetical protein